MFQHALEAIARSVYIPVDNLPALEATDDKKKSILQRMWDALVRAVKAIKERITKFISSITKWVKGLFKSNKDQKKAISELDNDVEAEVNIPSKLADVGHDAKAADVIRKAKEREKELAFKAKNLKDTVLNVKTNKDKELASINEHKHLVRVTLSKTDISELHTLSERTAKTIELMTNALAREEKEFDRELAVMKKDLEKLDKDLADGKYKDDQETYNLRSKPLREKMNIKEKEFREQTRASLAHIGKTSQFAREVNNAINSFLKKQMHVDEYYKKFGMERMAA